MRRVMIVAVLALGGALACSGAPATDETSTDQAAAARDSAVAGSKLPGAAGVRGAMKAADSADARNARLDSIAAQADP